MFQQAANQGLICCSNKFLLKEHFCSIAKWKTNKGGNCKPQLDKPKIMHTSGENVLLHSIMRPHVKKRRKKNQGANLSLTVSRSSLPILLHIVLNS